MEIKDALDIMNSDFKLWEHADDEPLAGGKVQKTIDLPWGIGKHVVIMEGMNDATQRRAAVSSYGEHIRDVIKEQISDENITSRAQIAAARAESNDSGDSPSVSGEQRVRDESVQEETTEAAIEAHEEDAEVDGGWRETLVARRASLIGRIERLTVIFDGVLLEIKGVEAALEATKDE
jgi:hypothetical protein